MIISYDLPYVEQFLIDLNEYEDTTIASLSFSVRTTNRLHGNGIFTVADLAQRSPAELLAFDGFGRGCITEVNNYFDTTWGDSFRKKEESRNKPNNFILQNKTDILSGNFAALTEMDLSDNQRQVICNIQEAHDLLGEELLSACLNNIEYVKSIISMFTDYTLHAKRLSTIYEYLLNIPTSRQHNLAKGYINAFTQDEEKRKTIAAHYSCANA